MNREDIIRFISSLDDLELINLTALSFFDKDKIDKLIADAPTEEARKFVTVAKYVHMGREQQEDGAA